MPRFHIVCDSSARFGNARLLEGLPVTVVPCTVTMNGQSYREDVDLPTEEILERMSSAEAIAQVTSPSTPDFLSVYSPLSQAYDGIISLHSSREINRSWYNAREAAQQLTAGCPIEVIDTQSVCAGYGLLVRAAAEASFKEVNFDDVVRYVRNAVERVYCMYYTETLDALRDNGLVSDSRAVLGSLLGIRPFISMEDGRLSVVEKARSNAQAIDGLVDFILEFDALDDAMIVQPRGAITESTRALQDRLTTEFPGQHFPFGAYSTLMASLIGSRAIGVAVLESEFSHSRSGLDDPTDAEEEHGKTH